MTAPNAKPSGKTAQGQEQQHDPVFEHLLPQYRAIRERNALLEMGIERANIERDALAAQNIELVALLTIHLAHTKQSIKDIGGCDHSVGICCCHMIHDCDAAQDLLAKLKP